jgi:hypothetical protein
LRPKFGVSIICFSAPRAEIADIDNVALPQAVGETGKLLWGKAAEIVPVFNQPREIFGFASAALEIGTGQGERS